jgi:hypothetical protein
MSSCAHPSYCSFAVAYLFKNSVFAFVCSTVGAVNPAFTYIYES